MSVRPAATQMRELAEEYGVPFLDVALIAANAEGARPLRDYPRARMQLRPAGSDEVWQIILPFDNEQSRFEVADGALRFEDEPIADVVALENDDVVLTYLRAGGRSITLNTHSRSKCTGCMFCPNVIEDASDDTLTSEGELAELLEWLQADNGWTDLSHADVITVCSGCFHYPAMAIEHMAAIRRAAGRYGFTGRLHLLSSVLRDRDDLARLRDQAGDFHLTLTLECFERRTLLLKDTKASLTLERSAEIMDDCRDLGIVADFTYVAGLDSYARAVEGISYLAPHAGTFPRIQVYQAHNDYMRRARHRDAEDLRYFLRLRGELEAVFAPTGLAPRSWENYRPLWYSSFNGRPVAGPRV
ncbi:hypothetical protein ACFPIJ_15885 [Dactylosporangium cerinum]|uniref:Radical SAM protein n=1 Tax=Dactylosporangium cerinum TaxID=1434730 RepID=A0ABV9VUS6_9ACTN